MSEYTPGTYAKGDSVRVAKSASQAVALVFDGYTKQDDAQAAEAPVAQPKADEPVRDEPAKPAAKPAKN